MASLENIFTDLSKLQPEEITALEEYMKSVDVLADKKWNLEFNNKDEFHAVIVMSRIFKTAERSIRMFTGTFSGQISNHQGYLASVREAVGNSDKSIEVVFEKQPNSDSECLKLLRELRQEKKNVNLYLLDEDFRKKQEQRLPASLNHFIIGDEQMFRYETGKNEFKAFCNFDDKKLSASLGTNFSILKLNSSPLI